MNKIFLVVILIAAGIAGLSQRSAPPPPPVTTVATAPAAASKQTEERADNRALAEAMASHARNVDVEVAATVAKVLPDDNDGLRHQRFIVRLDNGQSLLVAHNLDLAERVAGLHAGDRVVLHGEYVWNAKGGVIHWTHRDPRGRHRPGWIKHDGHTYQ